MSTPQSKATATHRNRLKRKGIVRVEVQAPEGDAPLIRRLARVLRENAEAAADIRAQLQDLAVSDEQPSFKALLASAPLDDIDLTRARDFPRDPDL